LKDCSVCQLTTGESEINAASTITALMLSTQFNLQKTYFLIAGIAGINPKQGTIADVAFSKYAVQVALQYEFDARDIPNNFSTGYVPQGAQHHSQYPQAIYGTEVFEVNEALRDMAAGFAGSAKLVDTEISKEYRSRYKGPSPNVYEKATRNPGIIKCDVATSDVYFSGTHLGEAFDNTTRLFTNGSGIPCMTAQEDNATLEAMIRFAKLKVMDFARIIIMRSAADFDRPYPGLPCIDNLFYTNQGAFLSSIANLYLAGTPVVKGILEGWKSKFEAGITPPNYIGDIFGTLGGAPDFGPGPQFRQKNPVTSFEKRSSDVEELSRRSAYRRHEMKGMEGAEIARIANGNA
jgi:purine nucleoside permease